MALTATMDEYRALDDLVAVTAAIFTLGAMLSAWRAHASRQRLPDDAAAGGSPARGQAPAARP